jgi:CdiI N-terminal domain
VSGAFSIGFLPVGRSRGSAERVGRIVLGTFEERFRASLEHWSASDYERHWREALIRLIEDRASCLITNMVAPTSRVDNLEWWPAWPLGDEACFQQEVLLPGKLDPPFDPDDPYLHLEDYEPSDVEAGLSEWRVPLRAIRAFVAATEPDGG